MGMVFRQRNTCLVLLSKDRRILKWNKIQEVSTSLWKCAHSTWCVLDESWNANEPKDTLCWKSTTNQPPSRSCFDGYQCQENDIIIFAAVRCAPSLGFCNNQWPTKDQYTTYSCKVWSSGVGLMKSSEGLEQRGDSWISLSRDALPACLWLWCCPLAPHHLRGRNQPLSYFWPRPKK